MNYNEADANYVCKVIREFYHGKHEKDQHQAVRKNN